MKIGVGNPCPKAEVEVAERVRSGVDAGQHYQMAAQVHRVPFQTSRACTCRCPLRHERDAHIRATAVQAVPAVHKGIAPHVSCARHTVCHLKPHRIGYRGDVFALGVYHSGAESTCIAIGTQAGYTHRIVGVCLQPSNRNRVGGHIVVINHRVGSPFHHPHQPTAGIGSVHPRNVETIVLHTACGHRDGARTGIWRRGKGITQPMGGKVAGRAKGKRRRREDGTRPPVGDIGAVAMRTVGHKRCQEARSITSQIDRIVHQFDSAIVVKHYLVRIHTVRLVVSSQQMVFDGEGASCGVIPAIGACALMAV